MTGWRVTDSQWSYIRRLMNEAFVHLYKNVPNLDINHSAPMNYSKLDASADITRLLTAKSRGWKD